MVVMELLGHSLQSEWEVAGLRLPANTLLSVYGSVCHCLGRLHAAGYVHNDLKPGNLLRGAGDAGNAAQRNDCSVNSSLSLVDFGLVAALSREEQRGYIGFLRALSRGDGKGAAACVLSWSRLQACASEACRDAFTADLAASCNARNASIRFPKGFHNPPPFSL